MSSEGPRAHIHVDGQQIEVSTTDSLLIALLRADLHPTGGGCLCLAGDCSHCLATVDGVGYARTCQIRPRDGAVVERHHLGGGRPPLLRDADRPSAGPAGGPGEEAGGPGQKAGHGLRAEATAQHLHCDVVVIGAGQSGSAAAGAARAEGRHVVTLDAGDGQEVAGIYPGPLVVARSHEATLSIHPREEIVIATGAAEIQPVAPGNELAGLVTARAASELARAGIDLGRVVAVGTPPEGIEGAAVDGELVRFEGAGRVEAVVVATTDGTEHRHECDTVSLGLGLQPRDALARMARGMPIRVVGGAACESDIPPCPRAGTVCPCSDVTVADLQHVWDNGFHELELVKRATLAGTGTCQGSGCVPHVRSFLAAKGRELQPPFTARPVTRQLTIAQIAAGAEHNAVPRTPLHDEHLALGAHMQRAGGWWRPWSYGDADAEYDAVRGGVSLGDVGTLGKFLVSGADANEFLELLYPTRVSTIGEGRSRYALLLDERGYVLDDGLICRERDQRFYLSLTSAGSTFGEMWLRDWAEPRAYDVRILNQTLSLGAICVTGPRAAELLARAGAVDVPGFARHLQTEIAGIPCRILRLSFTGELSYELHHAAVHSRRLWRVLLEAGEQLGVRPHGLDALLRLRLDKGHIVVGQDTDFDSTPRRIQHEWAVDMDKKAFVGRQAVSRTDRCPRDRQLVGLQMELPAPIEGATVWNGDEHAGYVTSSNGSRATGEAVMLAWLRFFDGALPDLVTVDGRPARRVELPFYDPGNQRARIQVDIAAPTPTATPDVVVDTDSLGGLQRLDATRVVARPRALDRLVSGTADLALRIAPDELLLLGRLDPDAVDDAHAIIEPESGFAGRWIDADETRDLLRRHCAWAPPVERPSLAQGELAGIPVKLWLEPERTLLLVAACYALELGERLG